MCRLCYGLISLPDFLYYRRCRSMAEKRLGGKIIGAYFYRHADFYALFGWHILNGGLYEMRTVIAMSLRTMVWAGIAMYAYRKIRGSDRA